MLTSPRGRRAARCSLRGTWFSVLAERGKLSVAELVRLRVRYFTDGVILGSKAFVDEVFAHQRGEFSPRRKTGARRISQCEEPLYSLRQLRLRAVG